MSKVLFKVAGLNLLLELTHASKSHIQTTKDTKDASTTDFFYVFWYGSFSCTCFLLSFFLKSAAKARYCLFCFLCSFFYALAFCFLFFSQKCRKSEIQLHAIPKLSFVNHRFSVWTCTDDFILLMTSNAKTYNIKVVDTLFLFLQNTWNTYFG